MSAVIETEEAVAARPREQYPRIVFKNLKGERYVVGRMMNDSWIAPADYPLLFTDRRPFFLGIRGGLFFGFYEEPACTS